MITDKGTFDAIGLSEDGQAKQALYVSSVHRLLQLGGLLIITSCNHTLQELVEQFTAAKHASPSSFAAQDRDGQLVSKGPSSAEAMDEAAGACEPSGDGPHAATYSKTSRPAYAEEGAEAAAGAGACQAMRNFAAPSGCHLTWVHVDHVRTYKVYSFGGYEGSRVCTVAFRSAQA